MRFVVTLERFTRKNRCSKCQISCLLSHTTVLYWFTSLKFISILFFTWICRCVQLLRAITTVQPYGGSPAMWTRLHKACKMNHPLILNAFWSQKGRHARTVKLPPWEQASFRFRFSDACMHAGYQRRKKRVYSLVGIYQHYWHHSSKFIRQQLHQ